MQLSELLQCLSFDTRVGIWNIDDPREKQPTPQTYQKAGNVPWSKLRNIIDYEVLGVCPVERVNGLLIKVYSKERLMRSLNNSDLAKKIREAAK